MRYILSVLLLSSMCFAWDIEGSSAPNLVPKEVINSDARDNLAAHLGDVVLVELFATT